MGEREKKPRWKPTSGSTSRRARALHADEHIATLRNAGTSRGAIERDATGTHLLLPLAARMKEGGEWKSSRLKYNKAKTWWCRDEEAGGTRPREENWTSE